MKSLKLFKSLLLSAFILSVKAEVTFKVVAVTGTPSVVINSKEYPMVVDKYPVYKVVVNDVSAPVEYHYKLINNIEVQEESFTRTCDQPETLNEFFDRFTTYKKLPLLPKVYEEYPTFKKSKLFDDNFVSTLVINANEIEVNNMHTNPTDKEIKISGINVVYVDPFDIKEFNNATIATAGQSTVKCKKLTYKISNLKTADGKELYNRSAIKLRANYRDPSYIRDKLYVDVLNTLGVPTAQSRFTRVFINGKAAGLYTLTDVITNQRYLRNTFNSGNKFNTTTYALFKADYWESGKRYGNLQVGEPTDIYYYKGEEKVFSNEEKVNSILVPFIGEIDKYPQTKILNFDAESFFKAMTVEYAAGAIDNFWIRPGNYFLFKDIGKNYWHFHDADFHFTFGLAIDGALAESKILLDTPINDYSKTNPGIPTPARPLIDNLRTNPDNEAFFMDAFKKLTQMVFNLNSIEGRIDAMVDLIREDVYWDLHLERLSKLVDPELQVYNYNETFFESQVKDITASPDQIEYFPIKYWIKARSENLAQQLGITIPSTIEAPLGYFEPLTHKKEQKVYGNSTSGTSPIQITARCLYSMIAILLITLIFF